MHSTLLSTSSHSLATQHLSRISSFPNLKPDSTSLADAHVRVTEAEAELKKQMLALHSSFVELMKRTLSRPGVADGNVTSLEVETIKERLDMLEKDGVTLIRDGTEKGKGKVKDQDQDQNRGRDGGRVGPSEPQEAHPPPPPESPMVNKHDEAMEVEPEPTSALRTKGEPGGSEPPEKRGKARQLLLELISRLEVVEAMKSSLEERYYDLENRLNSRDSEQMESEKRIETWGQLEGDRDPRGLLRGIDVDVPQTDVGSTVTSAVENATMTSAPSAVITVLEQQVKALREEVEEMKRVKEDNLEAAVQAAVAAARADITATFMAVSVASIMSIYKG